MEDIDLTGPQPKRPLAVAILVFFLFGTIITGCILGWFIKGDAGSGSSIPVISFCMLSLLLMLGMLLRANFKILGFLHLPPSVLGGAIGLVMVTIWRSVAPDSPTFLAVTAGWSSIAGFAINIVFAVLFLGETIPSIKQVWNICGLQFIYGQMVAWGQYVVGLGLGTPIALAFSLNNAQSSGSDSVTPPVCPKDYCTPINTSPMPPTFWTDFRPQSRAADFFGIIIPVGFEGGHGTAAGLGPAFIANGWPQGSDFALASATVGLLGGVLVGMVLVNVYEKWMRRMSFMGWGNRPYQLAEDEERLGRTPVLEEPLLDGEQTTEEPKVSKPKPTQIDTAVVPYDLQELYGRKVLNPEVQGALVYHSTLIALAMFFAYGLKQALRAIDEPLSKVMGVEFFGSFPLFPFSMLGGILLQLIFQFSGLQHAVDAHTCEAIGGVALDYLIVAALSTMKLAAVSEGIVPFAFMMVFGIAYHICMLLFVAPRIFKEYWFERSICELGQSMGVTATGLLLMKLADPKGKSPAPPAFAYKQLLHEPIMGGGIWTSLVLPLIAVSGPWVCFSIACTAIVIHTVLWAVLFRNK